ncbi:MAG TPA: O-antigen ligase family protein [Gaiellaceae bacterium]
MRPQAARGATLSVSAGLLVFAALFLSNGSSQSRLFWIGGAAVLVAAAGWAVRPPRLSGEGIAFFAALGVFVLWQGASVAWSIQPARSWDYANRGLVYFAFAAVGALLAGVQPRRLAEAAALLVGALFVWALAAKVIPGIYGDYGRLSRLRYPLGYWNELALLGAASVPLGLWLAGRREDRRARLGGTLLLYGALVVVVLTYSRVGVVLSVAAAAAWLALDRERLHAIGPLAVAWVVGAAVAGAGLLLPGVSKDGEAHGTRVQDGLVFGLVLVVGGVAVVLALRVLSARSVDRRLARNVAAVLVAVALAAFVASVVRAGGPAGFVRDRWHEFSNPVSSQVSNTPGRFASASSSNRWRWWQEAWNAFTDRPLEGTGAGTFGLTDRTHRRSTLAVVEPHSLPLQDLSETGIVGFLLGSAIAVAAALVILRRERSPAVVALGLALAVCVVHALVDIDWDYIAVEGPLLMIVGALAARPSEGGARRPRWASVGAIGVAALAGLYSLASPWLAGERLGAAYDAIGRLDAAGARSNAKAAHSLNPLAVEPLWVWAATETGQRAVDLYRQARDREPRNPETWYELGAYEYDLKRYRDAYRDLNQSYTLDRYGPAGVKGGLLDQARCKVDPATCPK